jgi:hypothetical protein
MNIRIDDQELEIFSGARVRDAILKYSAQEYRAVREGKKKVKDKHNNTVALDGELTHNQSLYIANGA